eukprot:m.87580 g.87580  ORF g.87580 m.87580 type:complete len:316 (-) comp9709_c0_seq1:87-1034(-)
MSPAVMMTAGESSPAFHPLLTTDTSWILCLAVVGVVLAVGAAAVFQPRNPQYGTGRAGSHTDWSSTALGVWSTLYDTVGSMCATGMQTVHPLSGPSIPHHGWSMGQHLKKNKQQHLIPPLGELLAPLGSHSPTLCHRTLVEQTLELRDVFSPGSDMSDDEDEGERHGLSGGECEDEGVGASPARTTSLSCGSTPSPDIETMSLCPPSLRAQGYAERVLCPGESQGLVPERAWLVEFASHPFDADLTHVSWVHVGGAGRRMGLRRGDILVAINGTPCDMGAQHAVVDALANVSASMVTHMTVLRKDIEGRTISVLV